MLSKQSVSTTKGTMLTFIKFATKHFYDFPNWILSSLCGPSYASAFGTSTQKVQIEL